MTYTESTRVRPEPAVALAAQPTDNLDAFRAASEQLTARRNEPEWARDLRRSALEAYRGQPFPHRGLELWRRTDFGSLPLGALAAFAEGVPARTVDDLPAPVVARLHDEAGHAAVFAQRGSTPSLEQTYPTLAAQGVVLCSLDRAVREHGDLVRAHLQKLTDLGHDKFTALAALLRSGGAFLHVPDGKDVQIPIRLFQWLERGGAVMAPHNLIVVGKNARATVVEEQLGEAAEDVAFFCGATEVFLGADSKLVFATLQEWPRNVYHYSNQRARLDRGAELHWVQTLLGARMVKTNSYYHLEGPGAQVFVHGFAFGDTQQHFDQHTLQKHVVDHCTSDLLIKVALRDRARSVYQGLIQVYEGAQRTDAYQANRNLLLSEKARADSIPGLEILANDVRCTHGATIGQIDEEQLYYLMARGLRRPEAQRLVVEGFFEPVLERIPLPHVAQQLREAIEKKVGR
jgi:Fe-S cluster assembly protein SufD